MKRIIDDFVVKVINHLLRNNISRKKLLGHEGKIFKINLPQKSFVFQVAEEGFLVLLNEDTPVDLELIVPADALLKIPTGLDNVKREIKISGNVEFASDISSVAALLEWDYEDDLASIFGDIIGNRIGSTIKDVLLHVKDINSSVRQIVSEYLIEEIKLIPSASEMESYIIGVDSVRDATDRLEVKISQLESQK